MQAVSYLQLKAIFEVWKVTIQSVESSFQEISAPV